MLNCGSKVPLIREIESLQAQGKTQPQIVETFVTKYGKVILSAPTTQGLDLAAWLTPFVVLMLGSVFVYVVIKAWLKRKPVLAQTRGNAGSIPEDYRARMEKELKELE